MRAFTEKMLALLLCCSAPWAAAESPPQSDDYRLALYIDDEFIEGAQERWKRVRAKPEHDRWAEVSDSIRTIVNSQVFQLKITVTDSRGGVMDYTGSPNLRYQSFGCIAVNAEGQATALGPEHCSSDQPSEVWVWLFADAKGTPTASNQYGFNVAGDSGAPPAAGAGSD